MHEINSRGIPCLKLFNSMSRYGPSYGLIDVLTSSFFFHLFFDQYRLTSLWTFAFSCEIRWQIERPTKILAVTQFHAKFVRCTFSAYDKLCDEQQNAGSKYYEIRMSLWLLFSTIETHVKEIMLFVRNHLLPIRYRVSDSHYSAKSTHWNYFAIYNCEWRIFANVEITDFFIREYELPNNVQN